MLNNSRLRLFFTYQENKKWGMEMFLYAIVMICTFLMNFFLKRSNTFGGLWNFIPKTYHSPDISSYKSFLIDLFFQNIVITFLFLVMLLLLRRILSPSFSPFFTIKYILKIFYRVGIVLVILALLGIFNSLTIEKQNEIIGKYLKLFFYDNFVIFIAFMVTFFSWRRKINQSIFPCLLPKINLSETTIENEDSCYPVMISRISKKRAKEYDFFLFDLSLSNTNKNSISNIHVFNGRLIKDLEQFDIPLLSKNMEPSAIQIPVKIHLASLYSDFIFSIYISFTCNNNIRYYQTFLVTVKNLEKKDSTTTFKIESKDIKRSFFPV